MTHNHNSPQPTEQPEVHELKIWPEYFDDVDSGKKNFEVRKLDRLFGVGDTLWLREWSPLNGYSGRETRKRVTYLMVGGQWGLAEGNCILGIEPLPSPQPESVDALGEEELEDMRILNEAKVSAFVMNWFEEWCNKTRRGGGVLITTSIKELLMDFYSALASHPSPSVDAEPSPQEAVEFAEWIQNNCDEYSFTTDGDWVELKGQDIYTTAELYQLFKQKNKI